MSDEAGPSRQKTSTPARPGQDQHAAIAEGGQRGKGKGKGKAPAQPPVSARPKPIPQPVGAFANPDQGEETTVHEVYERIAPHFSQTRHKPWPLITTFLNDLPPGSVGLDSGAGNGKYLPTAAEAGHTMIALDRSSGLLEIARRQPGAGDVVRGDLGATCWRDGVFDFVISVAAIHHLSTPERRRQAVQATLPCLRTSASPPYARFFIYVWAYEQGPLSKRAMGSLSSDPHANANADPTTGSDDEEHVRMQDVLVPWVLKSKSKTKTNSEVAAPEEGEQEETVYHRYYHLFVKDELRELVCSAAESEGYRILDPPAPADGQGSASEPKSGTAKQGGRWMRVKGEGWEADNWWIEAEVGEGVYKPEKASGGSLPPRKPA